MPKNHNIFAIFLVALPIRKCLTNNESCVIIFSVIKKTIKHQKSKTLFSSVYAPAVTDGIPNPSDERHLYAIARILGDFPNLANGERSAGIECLLTNGTVRRFRWDRLQVLTAS